jgi:nucleotide-binding universal stress UspA family protein
MKRLERILFPTDFSACADQALAVAADLARTSDAELHLLHAVILHSYDPDRSEDQLAASEEAVARLWEEVAEKRLTGAADGAVTPPRLVTAQRRGVSAADVIVAYAKEHDSELVVMGTHGRRGAGQLLLGSVAEQVVRRCPCPVLTVRERTEPQLISSVERLLVPVDFSDHARRALANAKYLAASVGASIQLLHVVEQVIHPSFYAVGKSSLIQLDPGLPDRCRQNLENWYEETPGPEIDVQYHVAEGKAVSEIVRFAERDATDLIVIATHGLSGLQHFLLGSVTEKVVRRAPCPVLTVKAFGRSFLD